MKRIYILTAICLFVSLALKAQTEIEPTKPPVRLAVRTGIFGSRYVFNNLPDGQKNPEGDDSFYAGLQADIPLSKNISVVPEVVYAQSSNNTYIGGLYGDFFKNLFVPVLVKYKLGKVSLMAGPQADFLLDAKGWYLEKAPESDPDYNYYFKSGDIKGKSYSNFTLSGVIGAEWVFKYRFGIDARYQFGLTNFRSDYKDFETVKPLIASLSDDIKFNGFQAGIFFRFGKKPGKN